MKPIREFTKPPTRDTISPKSGTPKQITNTRPTSVVCEAANGHSSEQVQQRTHRHATHPNDVASGLHPVLHAKNNGLLYYLTCGRKNLQHSTQVENHVCTRRAKKHDGGGGGERTMGRLNMRSTHSSTFTMSKKMLVGKFFTTATRTAQPTKPPPTV